MQAYTDYFAGKLTDQTYDESGAGDGAGRLAERGGVSGAGRRLAPRPV